MTPPVDARTQPTHANLGTAAVGDRIDGTFFVSESDLRPARDGRPYWRVRLLDEHGGSLGGTMFDFVGEPPAVGSVVELAGVVDRYGGGRVLRIERYRCLDGEAAEAWLPRVRVDRAELVDQLDAAIAQVVDPHLGALLDHILGDGETRERYLAAPAASKYHSARVGGLAMHSLAVRRLALEAADALGGYPCDRDLLAVAALLHDVGKIDELELSLATGGEAKWTTIGQLHGHIVHGVRRIERAAAAVGLPAALRDHLIHLIVSHHGQPSWGSPVVPMTPEAVALHVGDYAASRIEAVLDAADAAEPGGEWTGYSKMLEARLYLGFRPDQAVP